MYSLYSMYCEPPGHQGGHQGAHSRKCPPGGSSRYKWSSTHVIPLSTGPLYFLSCLCSCSFLYCVYLFCSCHLVACVVVVSCTASTFFVRARVSTCFLGVWLKGLFRVAPFSGLHRARACTLFWPVLSPWPFALGRFRPLPLSCGP
jgi:hypothetical protein